MRELLFADDSALAAHSAEDMQTIMEAFSDALKKTEVLNLQEPENRISWLMETS